MFLGRELDCFGEIVHRVLEAFHRQVNAAAVAIKAGIFRVGLNRLGEFFDRLVERPLLRELHAFVGMPGGGLGRRGMQRPAQELAPRKERSQACNDLGK